MHEIKDARRTTFLIALMMPLGPLCVAALRGVLPTFSSDKAVDVARDVAASPGRQSAVVWLGFAAMLLLVPGVLAAAELARSAAPRLAGWAVALLVPAYLSLGGLVAQDSMVWSGHDAGLDVTSTAALYEHSHPALLVATAVFVIGHVVGTVLLGLALMRSGCIGAVPGWALTVSQPLHFLGLVVIGFQSLDVFAWLLTTFGMGAAAVALVRRPVHPSAVFARTDLAAAGA